MEILNYNHPRPNCPACEQVGRWRAEETVRRKLEAAEGMEKALTTISGWSKCQCHNKHGDNPNCCVLIAEAALSKPGRRRERGKG